MQRISNPVFFDVLDPIPLEQIGWEIRVFERNNPSTLVALIARWVNLNWTKPLSDIGAFALELERDDRVFTDPLPTGISSTIFDEDETIWRIYWNGIHRATAYVEDIDKDHVRDDGRHVVKVTGRTVGKLLEHATVLPPGWPTYSSKDHVWTGVSSMKAWKDLFYEAKARGVIPTWMTTAITDSLDTSGVPWEDSGDLTIPPGGNLLELIRRFSEVSSVDWMVDKDFVIDVRKDYGHHREDTIVFHVAGAITQFQEQKTRRDLKTHVFVEGGNGIVAQASDTTAEGRWGRREVWLSAGDASDLGMAGTYATSALATLKNEAKQITAKVLPEVEDRLILTDYDTGDWVTLESDEVVDGDFVREAVKVVAASFNVDENGLTTLELTLSTKMQEALIRMNQALARMTGSGTVSPTQSQAQINTRSVIQSSFLDDLQDVDTTGAASGSVLRRSGSNWVDDLLAINELDNVVITSPVEGHVLGYDPATSKWKNEGPEAWVAVAAFTNGWGNAGGWDAASYRKDPLACVHLKGTLSGGTPGLAAFTLPAAYRPATNKRFANVDVLSNGQVIPQTGGALEGVSFFTD